MTCPSFVLCGVILLIATISGRSMTINPEVGTSVAADQTPPMEELMAMYSQQHPTIPKKDKVVERLMHLHPAKQESAFIVDEALDTGSISSNGGSTSALLEDPEFSFEGMNYTVNIEVNGLLLVPPDPVGDVGVQHYVQMVNDAFAVYNKDDGSLAAGPYALGALWQDFAIEDCAKPNGDPIVLYDQLVNRWLLTQFSRGCRSGSGTCFNCAAISQTSDPTGGYNRYAFVAQEDPRNPGNTVFPDYPKWGVWDDYYILTTRDFGIGRSFGVSVYAVEKAPMLIGNRNTRVQRFTLSQPFGGVPWYLYNNGLLPVDIDGNNRPPKGAAAPVIGTVDAGLAFDEPWAPYDALNIWELTVNWSENSGSLTYGALLPVSPFTTTNSCGGTFGCVPQPGVPPADYLSALSPLVMHRLAYRNLENYESMVVCQSVVAAETGGAFGQYGKRWYEIRRSGNGFSVHQQGTFAPPDDVSRWMGSIAQDGAGNIAMAYSVSDAVFTFPGLRVTGRLADDSLNFMTLGEATIIDGGGVQKGSFNRWGDYSSMNIDPEDDCTFWFTGAYYSKEGQDACDVIGFSCWQTRVASFQLPGCKGSGKEGKGGGKNRGNRKLLK